MMSSQLVNPPWEKNIPTSYSHRINIRWIKELNTKTKTCIFMDKAIKQ